jgi:LAO/AO transport system kinase
LVVVVPGSGDEVQSMKAGLMEIADIFVLNKSDYEQAGRFEEQLLFVLQLAPPREGWNPKIVRTVATEEKGIAELAGEIAAFREAHEQSHQRPAREAAFWENWLLRLIQQRLTEQVTRGNAKSRSLQELARAVASREKDPYTAAEDLLATLGLRQDKKL